MRRTLAAISAAAMIAGLSLVAAAPAHADTVSVTVDCVTGSPYTKGNPMVLTVHQGDTVMVSGSVTHPCDAAVTGLPMFADVFASWPTYPVADDVWHGGVAPFTWVVSDTAPVGASPLAMMGVAQRARLRYSLPAVFFTLNILEKSAVVPTWHQATGRHASTDPCPDGWNAGWELWMNAGKGGYVCTRDIPAYGNQ